MTMILLLVDSFWHLNKKISTGNYLVWNQMFKRRQNLSTVSTLALFLRFFFESVSKCRRTVDAFLSTLIYMNLLGLCMICENLMSTLNGLIQKELKAKPSSVDAFCSPPLVVESDLWKKT